LPLRLQPVLYVAARLATAREKEFIGSLGNFVEGRVVHD
jgi:hypothetical protein